MSEELHPPETITSIVLVRHGHTQATEMGLLYSDQKLPLTEKGVDQAKLAADWCQRFKADTLICGSAVRVAQSAEPHAKLTGLTPQTVHGFEEWQVGAWEGRTYLDIKKNDPEIYKAWTADPINNAPPGGESIDDLVVRIGKSLRELISNPDFAGKKIIMVTHSGIIRSMILHALDVPVNNFWRLAIPTGSVSRLDFSASFATLQYCGVRPD